MFFYSLFSHLYFISFYFDYIIVFYSTCSFDISGPQGRLTLSLNLCSLVDQNKKLSLICVCICIFYFSVSGVHVFIDSKAQLTLLGTEMDYIESKLTSEFVFNNPNIKGTCGCGESFNL